MPAVSMRSAGSGTAWRSNARSSGSRSSVPTGGSTPVEAVNSNVPHEAYLARWGGGRKEVVLVGMNPGPFGMAQTGVPFGEVEAARSFLGITQGVRTPRQRLPRSL